ncbi:O-methyltransferase, partial [Staphylococcus epidermidis]
NRTKNILEIGTPIAYTSIQFANISKHINLTTIQRNQHIIHLPKNFIKNYPYHNQIPLIQYHALNAFQQLNHKQYHIIFIHPPKPQSIKFFQLYTPLLKKPPILLTHNLLYHPFLSNIH